MKCQKCPLKKKIYIDLQQKFEGCHKISLFRKILQSSKKWALIKFSFSSPSSQLYQKKNVCIIVFFLTWLLQWPPDLEMTFTLRKVGIADLILNRYQNGEIKSESCKANFKLVKTESWDLSFYCFEFLRLNSKNSNQMLLCFW